MWLALMSAGFTLWWMRLRKIGGAVRAPAISTIYLANRIMRLFRRQELQMAAKRLQKGLREAGWHIPPELYMALNALAALLSLIGLLFGLQGLYQIGFLALMMANGMLYVRIQRFRNHLRSELGEVQELFLVQLQMSTALDQLYSYAAEMVEDPLKKTFQQIATAIRTRQDVRSEIRKLREMTNQIEVVTFSHIMERYLDSGAGHKAVEALSKSVEQYRVYRHEMDRRASMAKLIFAGVMMIGSVSLITLVPNVIEMVNTIYSTFQ